MQNHPVQTVSVIVPVFNESEVLPLFHRRLKDVLSKLPFNYEIIYINDGSGDGTWDLVNELKNKEPQIALIDLSRNFGKELALSAGLDYAKGDAVVVIDADLQDPPELIPELLNHWQQGFDVIYAKRTTRHGETWFKKFSAHYFYKIIHRLSNIPIPEDTGDFRVLSKRAVFALRQCKEHHRFMKGLFSWIGFKQTAVLYERAPRAKGETKWNYLKLWELALEGITSFTIVPLKCASYLGFLTAFSAFLYALFIIYKTLRFGESVQGYPSLMVVMLFLGGIQLITLGIIGEYLGRTFNESKQRPLYLVQDYQASDVQA